MKKLFVVGILAGVLALQFSSARAEPRQDPNDPAVIKAKMLENYLGLREAIKNRDADFIIASEAPEFTSVQQGGGVTNKEESDKLKRTAFERIQKIYDVAVTVKAIEIQPQRVVVLKETRIDFDFRDSEGQIHRVKISDLSRDIWVRYQSEWFVKRSEDVQMNQEK